MIHKNEGLLKRVSHYYCVCEMTKDYHVSNTGQFFKTNCNITVPQQDPLNMNFYELSEKLPF